MTPGRLFSGVLTNGLFWATTVIPTMLASIYFGLFASDIYVSESRFMVRSPERQLATPLGLLLKGSGLSKAQDDSYAVQDYILSRDALRVLDGELQLKKSFSSAKVDVLNRFGALDWDDSFEALHRYYQKKVSVQIEASSSIVTLTTRAFSSEEAYAINRRLVDMSETLVNALSERARKDLIRYAVAEVADAEKRAASASVAVARYRNEKGVIDPEKQAAIPLQQIAKLQEELIATKSQILQLERVARESSQLPGLHQHRQLLEREIGSATQRVSGIGNDRSLASKAADYQRLVLEREFAEKMLASAMASLEQARSEAQRKQLYLDMIVQPSTPDHSLEPRRIRAVFSVFVIGLMAWGVLAMLIASIKEHMD